LKDLVNIYKIPVFKSLIDNDDFLKNIMISYFPKHLVKFIESVYSNDILVIKNHLGKIQVFNDMKETYNKIQTIVDVQDSLDLGDKFEYSIYVPYDRIAWFIKQIYPTFDVSNIGIHLSEILSQHVDLKTEIPAFVIIILVQKNPQMLFSLLNNNTHFKDVIVKINDKDLLFKMMFHIDHIIKLNVK